MRRSSITGRDVHDVHQQAYDEYLASRGMTDAPRKSWEECGKFDQAGYNRMAELLNEQLERSEKGESEE